METRMKKLALVVMMIITTFMAAVLLGVTVSATSADEQQFSAWSPAVNVGPVVNSAYYDACPTISKSGLSLYFRSNRPGGYGGFDIWVSQRYSLEDPWEPPINLGPTINGPYSEYCTTFSVDGHWMVFVSDRPGCGGQDLWISHRKNKRDDFGWETPENLGCIVNSSATENSPAVFEDEATGQTFLYFGSNRPGGKGQNDIYVSTMVGDDHEIFGAPIGVSELNTEKGETAPFVRRTDGLEIIFQSGRPGGVSPAGMTDLWVSTRPDTLSPWSTPVNLGAPLNKVTNEGRPSLSWDGTTLYLATDGRQGDYADVSMATRTKLKDKDPD